MKLRIRHNLTDAQLQKAVLGLVSSQGIEAQVGEALLKAAGCGCEPREPKDPATLELYRRFQRLYDQAQADIKTATERILRGAGMVKAGEITRHLTREEVAQLVRTIRERFHFIAAQIDSTGVPSKDALAAWKAQGWIGKNVTAKDFSAAFGPEAKIIRNAFLFGRAWQAVEGGATFADAMKLAVSMPLLKPDLHAIAIAEQQTANYITAFGDDIAKMAGELAARNARDVVRDMAVQFHAQRLQARVLDREAKEHAGLTIPEKQVTTWREFSSELYHAMEDKSRDWDRVAFYEITDAQRQGQAMQALEEHGPKQLVYKMPLPTACPQCKHLYLEEDGTPRLFQLSELLTNGTNIGRKAHPVRGGKVVPGGRPDGDETLKATAGLVHPWCACLGVYIATGKEPWLLQKRNRSANL